MTLTAMTRDFRIINPSAMVEGGLDKNDVSTLMRQIQEEDGFFCPHCFRCAGEMSDVRFRNSNNENRRLHFFHPSSGLDVHRCTNYNRESEKHIRAKSWLEQHYKGVYGVSKVECDRIYLKTEEGQKRKPDLLVFRNDGTYEAVEVQISPIATDDLMKRTQDLLQNCAQVTWYLHGSNYSVEVRQWLYNLGCPCYRLDFSQEGIPSWELDKNPPKQKGRAKSSEDSCKEKPKTKGKSKKSEFLDPSRQYVTHCRKPGWIGYIHEEWPESCGSQMIDVMWVKCPENCDVPRWPSRYSSQDLQRMTGNIPAMV